MISLLEFIKEISSAMIEANIDTKNIEFNFDSFSGNYYCKLSKKENGSWENFGFCLNDVKQLNMSYEEMSAKIRSQIYGFIKDGCLTTGGK